MKKFSGTVYSKEKYGVIMLCFFIVLSLCFAGRVFWKKCIDAEIETGTDIKDAEENVLYETVSGSAGKKEYTKWVEFHVTKEALQLACEYDIETHDTEYPIDWVELLAYLAACYGGDFCRFEPADMNEAAEELISRKQSVTIRPKSGVVWSSIGIRLPRSMKKNINSLKNQPHQTCD